MAGTLDAVVLPWWVVVITLGAVRTVVDPP